MTTLQQLATNLWVAEGPVSFLGARIGTRMTLVRLSNGEIWVHSPIALDDGLCAEIRALGRVSYIIAPNLFHHLFLADAIAAFPEAKVYGAKGLVKKRPEIDFDEELSDEIPSEWRDSLAQRAIRGTVLRETVFFHPSSRTLISSDLAVNVHHSDHAWSRWYFKLNGVYGRFGLSKVLKFCYRDRDQARADLERVLEWDFDRVIVAHGDVLETGGKRAVRDAFDWMG